MNTFFEPTIETEEVKILQHVNVNEILTSLKFYMDKLSDTNKQVSLRWAGSFEGLSDLRYKQSNPLGYTQNDFVDWQPGTEYIQTLATKLKVNERGRVRLLQVNPRSCYSFHFDPHPYRVHIPLITNDGSFMVVWGKLWRMKLGSAYRVRVKEEHTALNTGESARIHLVFDNCFE